MTFQQIQNIVTEQKKIYSTYLEREVTVDFYLPLNPGPFELSLLVINDGQDLSKMDFGNMLDVLLSSDAIKQLLVVGIHAGERLSEFGTSQIVDFKNRGERAGLYQQFIVEELMPFVHFNYSIEKFKSKAIAGFSLGALSAFDTIWAYPQIFSIAGMFSGSFWWRIKDLDDGYNENTDRIMHQKIRSGTYYQGLRFYFTTGSFDEAEDRNHNGVIDSIDDTVALISELQKLGYSNTDISYINYEEGRHDVDTWGKAMPAFLMWGWGTK